MLTLACSFSPLPPSRAHQLLDSCIKNGGDHFLAEVGTKEYVDVLTGLLKSSVRSPASCVARLRARAVAPLLALRQGEC